jgi:hypothetical protein
MLNQLRPALVELLLRVVNSNPLFKRAGAVGVPPLENASFTLSNKTVSVSDTGTKKRPSKHCFSSLPRHPSSSGLPIYWQRLPTKQWETVSSALPSFKRPYWDCSGVIQSFPRNSVEVHFSVFKYFPEADFVQAWLGSWSERVRRTTDGCPALRGITSCSIRSTGLSRCSTRDISSSARTTSSRRRSRFDSRLIIQAFRESNGVAYYASATVDVITGIRMGQSLTPLPSYRGASEERRRDDDVFPLTMKEMRRAFLDAVEDNLEKLGAAMAGKDQHSRCEWNARPISRDKIISEEMKHTIRDRLGARPSDPRQPRRVSQQIDEHHQSSGQTRGNDIDSTPLCFDPDALLKDLFRLWQCPTASRWARHCSGQCNNVDEGVPFYRCWPAGAFCALV